MQLSDGDLDGLQQAILGLYTFRDLESFRRALPEIFLRIVPADYFGLVEHKAEPPAQGVTASEYPESAPRTAPDGASFIQSRILAQPIPRRDIAGGGMTALKICDFLKLSEVRRSEDFQGVYQFLGVYRTMSLQVSGGGGSAAIGMGNRAKDFTERDRLMLDLIRPHYDQAHRNAELVTSRLEARARSLAEYALSPREAAVALWLAGGKTNPEIAIILQSSPRTVEKHVERILVKLGVENRTGAAVMLAGAGIIAGKALG